MDMGAASEITGKRALHKNVRALKEVERIYDGMPGDDVARLKDNLRKIISTQQKKPSMSMMCNPEVSKQLRDGLRVEEAFYRFKQQVFS